VNNEESVKILKNNLDSISVHIVRAHTTIRAVDAQSVRADRTGHDAVVTDVSIQERSWKGEGITARR
jgi:hypothetical protein